MRPLWLGLALVVTLVITATHTVNATDVDEQAEVGAGVGIADHVINADLQHDESDAADDSAEADSDVELVEVDVAFEPFQTAANVMPYNIATDPGHNFMNPFLRGFNPAYDGFTPQPGGGKWNNPNGPYWSPFHWSAPSSYWSVYPPQYASSYVNPGMYHAPGMHQFLGPNYNGGHRGHVHGPNFKFPYGSMDPHVYGPHLDWPFGALTSDMDHIPGMGAGVNAAAPGVLNQFPQFIETSDAELELDEDADADEESDSESEPAFFEAAAEADAESESESESESSSEAEAEVDADAAEGDGYEIDSTNHIIPYLQSCVNCQFN